MHTVITQFNFITVVPGPSNSSSIAVLASGVCTQIMSAFPIIGTLVVSVDEILTFPPLLDRYFVQRARIEIRKLNNNNVMITFNHRPLVGTIYTEIMAQLASVRHACVTFKVKINQ